MDKLKLIKKEFLVDNVWAFRFESNESLHWQAGQFIRVELPHDHPDNEGTKRWFTISSAPYEKIIQITTRITDSTFKKTLANLPIGGEILLIEKPDGNFVWQEVDQPIIFIAGGIGITPFYSILKQMFHDHKPLIVTLAYGNRSDEIPFRNELDEWAKMDDEFTVNYFVGAPLTAEGLYQSYPQLSNSLVYLSGPEPMVESLGNQLKEAGLPEDQLKQDFFPNYDENNY